MADIKLVTFLTNIADAIRYVEKSSGEISATDFEKRIRALALSGGQPIAKTLLSISVTKAKTEYDVDDVLNLDDITTVANYSDSSHAIVIGTYNRDDVDMSQSGTYSIVVSYTEDGITKTNSISIVVNAVSPERPIVPQSGTWQLKNTSGKKYIVLATDDDNMGNPKYFRLLRTYRFPYTMNTEAEKINSNLGTDVDDVFTENDAPSLFPNNITVKELGKYLHDNNLGEVAQHGSSRGTLWDSSKLVGDYLDNVYERYTTQGGTKTKDELRLAIMEQLKASDGSQDASYVEDSRATLENELGFYIDTVGIWGGVPTATIDGIELGLNSIKGTSDYNWKAHNYWAVASVLDGGVSKVTHKNPYRMYRTTSSIEKSIEEVNNLKIGDCLELFWHYPFGDVGIDGLRTLFNYIKSLVDDNKVEVVTRKQFAKLGEYVANPITKITVSRSGLLNVGDTDSDDAYNVVVTYADATTSQPMSDVIIDRSAVDTTQEGTYVAKAYYRGFIAECSVVVTVSSDNLPEDLPNGYYYEIAKCEDNNKYYLIAQNESYNSGSASGSNAWHWDSSTTYTVYTYVSDNNKDWISVASAVTGAGTIKTNTVKYWGDYIITSKNFTTLVSVTQHIKKTYPEGLKDKEYWCIANDTTKGKLIAVNTTSNFGTLKGYNPNFSTSGPYFVGCTSGKLNSWYSEDDGQTWITDKVNSAHYQTISSSAISTYVTNKDIWIVLETSGNFDMQYFD